ncbi:MAG TPA: hypothetical protein VLB03_08315 [Nocardioidaceae bacterium]|nr:hypothetical protein [Nocardioidaceae bacterium]
MTLMTYADLCRDGMNRSQIERAVADGQLQRVLRGIYAPGDVTLSTRVRAKAITLASPPGIVVVRRTAAWLRGIDVMPPGVQGNQMPLEIAVAPHETPPRRSGLRGFRTSLPPSDLVVIDGVATTTDLRTAIDCGRFLPRLEAVAAVDAFLHAGRVDRDALWARAALLAGLRNSALLRDVVEVSDAGGASAGESWTRVRIVDAGLPRPQTQIAVGAQRAGWAQAYLDMGYLAYLLAVEFDGEEFHGPEAAAHDTARRHWLSESHGWDVIVVRKSDALRDHPLMVATVAERLIARGAPIEPVVLERIARAAALHRAGRHRAA